MPLHSSGKHIPLEALAERPEQGLPHNIEERVLPSWSSTDDIYKKDQRVKSGSRQNINEPTTNGAVPAKVKALQPRRTTATIITEAQFVSALVSNAEVDLTTNILLTSSVVIDGKTGVVINGNDFAVDGQNTVDNCFRIYDGSAVGTEVTMRHLIITRGRTGGNGGGFYIDHYNVKVT